MKGFSEFKKCKTKIFKIHHTILHTSVSSIICVMLLAYVLILIFIKQQQQNCGCHQRCDKSHIQQLQPNLIQMSGEDQYSGAFIYGTMESQEYYVMAFNEHSNLFMQRQHLLKFCQLKFTNPSNSMLLLYNHYMVNNTSFPFHVCGVILP